MFQDANVQRMLLNDLGKTENLNVNAMYRRFDTYHFVTVCTACYFITKIEKMYETLLFSKI